jgi:tetratricopeptide (TPR) repeat protein
MREADLILIEQYLDDSLETRERMAFEERLRTDPDLAKAVEAEKELRLSLQQLLQHAEEETALKKTLGTLRADHFPVSEPTKVVGMRRFRMAMAAALLVAAIAAAWWFFGKNDPPGKLYSQYALHEKLGNTRSNGQDDDRLREKAAESFNNGSYAEAMPLLEQYTTLHADATDALIAKGVCYLETGRYPQATALFEQLRSQLPARQSVANWYLALIQLKQGKITACRDYLQQIKTGEAYYSNARSLLKALKE